MCDFAERHVAQTHCSPNLLDLKQTSHRIPRGAHFGKHSLKGENSEAKEKEAARTPSASLLGEEEAANSPGGFSGAQTGCLSRADHLFQGDRGTEQ